MCCLASARSGSDVNMLDMEPVRTLHTCAGKVIFLDLVLPAALPSHQPVPDNAGTTLTTVISKQVRSRYDSALKNQLSNMINPSNGIS